MTHVNIHGIGVDQDFISVSDKKKITQNVQKYVIDQALKAAWLKRAHMALYITHSGQRWG